MDTITTYRLTPKDIDILRFATRGLLYLIATGNGSGSTPYSVLLQVTGSFADALDLPAPRMEALFAGLSLLHERLIEQTVPVYWLDQYAEEPALIDSLTSLRLAQADAVTYAYSHLVSTYRKKAA